MISVTHYMMQGISTRNYISYVIKHVVMLFLGYEDDKKVKVLYIDVPKLIIKRVMIEIVDSFLLALGILLRKHDT